MNFSESLYQQKRTIRKNGKGNDLSWLHLDATLIYVASASDAAHVMPHGKMLAKDQKLTKFVRLA